MSRFSSVALLAVGLGPLFGCVSDKSTSSDSSDPVFTDSVNVKYTLSCSGSICVANPLDSSIEPLTCQLQDDGQDVFALVRAHVAAVAAVHISPLGDLVVSDAYPSRPLVCTSDAECPNSTNTGGAIPTTFTCLNGLCQYPAREVATDDVIALCQADIPWPTSCPYITTDPFASRLAAIARTCRAGANCTTVPPECRQLTAPPDAGTTPDAAAPSPDAAPPITGPDAALAPITGPDAAVSPDAGDAALAPATGLDAGLPSDAAADL